MEIPERIDGIRMEDIPEMAAHADKESNPLYPVPRLMDGNELAAMYEKIAENVEISRNQKKEDGLAYHNRQMAFRH